MKLIKWAVAALAVIIIVILAYSTFVEQAHGTDYAHRHIYASLWFFLLWAAVAVLGTIYYLRQRKMLSPRCHPAHLLHASFLIILAGAALTHFTGRDGQVHLRKGAAADCFYDKDSGRRVVMPFSLELRDFRIDYYPGTQAPADFVSTVVCKEKASGSSQTAVISMNHIFTDHGYRFYQSSFDPDRQGTVLSVNYDPWGIGITYTGYALLGISMVLLLVYRRGEFRRLLHHPALRHTAVGLLLFLPSLPALSAPASIPTVSSEKAANMARQQVIYNDRVAPFSTLAHDFLQKIYGRSSYRNLSAEQVVVGWSLRPEVWKDEPMIKIKDGALRRQLGISGKYASLANLFNADGSYKLGTDFQPSATKSLRELDEKVGLILMAANGSLIQARPDSVPPLSPFRVSAEIAYNTLPVAKVLFMVNLTVGFLLFFLMSTRLMRRVLLPARILLALSFLAILFSYSLRWFIAGRIPLANGFETMQFLALSIMLTTLILTSRGSKNSQHKAHDDHSQQLLTPLILTSGFLLSGFTLLVAHLGQMNPQITPLMPVLQSPLLSLHVSIIMIAYALLAIIALNAVYALCITIRGTKNRTQGAAYDNRRTLSSLTVLSRLLLYPAVFFLGIGIFLGAVWANVSWGRYWSWDPKEVWALITFIIYGAAFHHRSIPFLRRCHWFHLYMLFAFLAVLMTYFGVNYFLGGMHSYA